VADSRQAFYQAIDAEHLAPLWEVMGDLVPREPRTPCVPVHWSWSPLRTRLIEAAGLITAQEAERRVLVLENPGLRHASSLTHSLYAGVQLLMPGEIAPSHRHTATAVRLVMEGECAYTTVDGERASMRPGDFIITPSWSFHDHGNPGDEPVIWLDGLDVPMVQMFDAAFSEKPEQGCTPLPPRTDDAQIRYSGLLMPTDHPAGGANPVFRYPYSATRATLAHLAQSAPAHPVHGIKLRFSHPGTGGWPTPTIGAFMQLLPESFSGREIRSTDAAVYCVVEGAGFSEIGGKRFDWSRGDIFMVPSWVAVRHCALEQAVLFSMSDRPAQQALGIWREAMP
jgi:gentisate 1,2-dioxygenase